MVYSVDLRWRAIFLYEVYGKSLEETGALLSVSKTQIWRWVYRYRKTGDVVIVEKAKHKRYRYDTSVLAFLHSKIDENPCFYLYELQELLQKEFPRLTNTSLSTICRAINHDLGLPRKRLQAKAIERSILDRLEYWQRLSLFYTDSSQLVFIDETSKDARDCRRYFGRAARGEIASAYLPGGRGTRYSVLAFLDETGFIDWGCITGTFTREVFHKVIMERLIPVLNPYPYPRSIVILDNASIHHYPEFYIAVRSQGACVINLPTYSPDYNPIEIAFNLIKSYITSHNVEYLRDPLTVLNDAFTNYSQYSAAAGLFKHCGYEARHLTPRSLV
jgi:transposase